MVFRLVLFIFAVGTLVNGVWMLAAPQSWYTDLPGGVADTGPYNGHFIRDLGVVFVFIASGFVWCAMRPDRSRNVLLVNTLFFSGHAVLHLLDLLTHRLPVSHWKLDLPLVFLPTVVLIVILLLSNRLTTK